MKYEAMDEYREKVERLAREHSGEPVYNSSIEHAAIIIEKLIKHAKSDVCIVTQRLNGHVFGRREVVDESAAFLSDASHKFRILMEDDRSSLSEGHPLIQEGLQHSGFEIRRIDPEVTNKIDFHFTLADSDSYRFEPDKNKWEAVGVFGDDKGAKRLRQIFDKIWELALPLDLHPTQTV